MSATWADVARKDVEDATRSKVLWGVTTTFVAFLVMSMLSAEELVQGVDTVTASIALAGVATLAQLFIPGVALVAGYLAVTGERQSGSLRVLLSYPFSRSDVVFGKLVGRTVVTVTALLVGFAVASVLVVALYGAPSVATFAGFVASGVLLGVVFTGLAVGGSAFASTRGRAMALTIGPFVAMVFFWKPVVVGIYYAVNGALPGVQAGTWYFLLKRLNPLEAYRVLVGGILDEPVHAVPDLPLEDLPEGVMPAQLEVSERVAGEVPFYLQDWFAVVVLLAWGIVPVLVGYWRFTRNDLG